MQSVTGLGERSRKGITEGLRNFNKVDNHCALDVGHLHAGIRSFEVRRPKFEEGGPEVSIGECPEELTVRADEVGSLKSCINVDHIAEDRCGPPLVDADWYAFCQAIYKDTEGSDWGKLYDYYTEMSRAAGVRKPSESQKARAFWRMKAAGDGGDDFYDPEHRHNILGRNKTRLEMWEEHFKDPIVALDKAMKCVKNPYQG